MKETILRDALTKHPGPGGRPLFKNASKLAAQIVCLKNSGYDTTEQDIRKVAAFVNQVFRGERSCSERLEKLLVGAVGARVADEKPDVVQRWTDSVRDAIRKQNEAYESEESGVGPPPDNEALYTELLTNAKIAKLQFIVTSMTLEEETTSKRADDLREILIERLHLNADAVNRKKPTEPSAPECRYIFLLPGEDAAMHFWENLYMRLSSPARTAKSGPADVAKVLDDRDRRDSLQVYVVEPPAICGVPVVAFDPDLPKKNPPAFSFCFDDRDQIRIIKWDEAAAAAWKLHVYRQFRLFKHRRYRWETAKQFIDELAEPARPV